MAAPDDAHQVMKTEPSPAAQAEHGAEEHRDPNRHAQPGHGHDEAEVESTTRGTAAAQGSSTEGPVFHDGGAPGELSPREQVDFPRWRDVSIGKDHAGRRADVFMSMRFENWSRTEIAKAIKAGEVTSASGRTLKPSSKLRENEVLRVFIPGLAPDTAPPPLPEILYEDDRLMVIDKPSGMLVHPSGKEFVYALIGLVRAARPGIRVDLAHRLDRETSGCIIVTKDKEANALVKKELVAGRVRKQYQAVVHGSPEWDEVSVKAPLAYHPDSKVRLRRGVVPGGQKSHTDFRVLERMGEHSLVACRLHTGRTHQIRIHLDHVGHAILGDKLYGQPDEVFLDWLDHRATDGVRTAVGFPRHCLHAWRVVFPHPDGHRMGVEAPLPPDMQAIVDGAPPQWPAEGES